MNSQAEQCYQKLKRRLHTYIESLDQKDQNVLQSRIEKEFPKIFDHLSTLYGYRSDFFYHLEEIFKTAIDAYIDRSVDLKKLDLQRINKPNWHQSEKIVGAMAYTDLFAGNIKSLNNRISYLKKLNVNYFHLMPFFDCPSGQNDGGYAVSDYRTVRKDLGTIKDVEQLAANLRNKGISLVADFVFNHTSNEHTWAKKALAGEKEYQDYYYMFPDRTVPDQYDATLREIFPDTRRGSFTWVDDIKQWVWTTFHNYQWDLNYSNPDVFRAIASEMLFLANIGVEVLRLDAIAFTGKKMGTTSENQNEAHLLVKALNGITNIAAPAIAFKSEAIVHPDFVKTYISEDECELSYNPLLMALMWEALATRDTKLLHHSMKHRFQIDNNTTWINYVRCHDDIGWTFSDEDAASLGINAYDHRSFLNHFYVGDFPGSFSKGEAFQFNPDTGDMRICGMAASLTGLEKGFENDDPDERGLSIQRMTLMYAVSMFIGGIPLIYLGDELALMNDYSYRKDPVKETDSRWVNRVETDENLLSDIENKNDHHGKMYSNMVNLINIRTHHTTFGATETVFHDTSSQYLFSFSRGNDEEKVLFVGNFSEHSPFVSSNLLINNFGVRVELNDIYSSRSFSSMSDFSLKPYQFLLLEVKK